MEVVNLSHNDDIVTIVKKCNLNFKNIMWQLTKTLRTQQIVDVESLMESITSLSDDVARMESVTIPNEVASQIAAQDIPGLVSQASAPPVGSYMMSQSSPASSYSGTTWQQVDSVTTDGSVTIPLWQRAT